MIQAFLRRLLILKIDPGIGDLLRKLDGLPLALATAGSYLGLTGIPVSDYLHDYEASWLELQETSPELLSYERRIYSTWDLSYNLIRKEDESAAKLLELWAYFDNQDLWYGLLKAGNHDWAPSWFRYIIGTKLIFRAAVMKLQKHALVEVLTDSDGYSMHHCVHAWLKNVLCKTIENQNMRLAFVCVGDTVPFEAAQGDWVIKQRLLPHSERCLKLLREWDQEGRNTESKERCITRFSYCVGCLYLDWGRLMEGESVLLRAFNSCEKLFGPDGQTTLSVVERLAGLYGQQGHLSKAESMYQRALTGLENTLGLDHELTLITVGNLGGFYVKKGMLKEAESMSQRALTGLEKLLGPDHISTLTAVNNLGVIYQEKGMLKEAESMIQRAFTGAEKLFAPDHVSTLNAVNNLGVIYQEKGMLKEAESMIQRAFTGAEKLFAPDHVSTLNAVNNLGNLYSRQGKVKEAESMYQRVLSDSEKTFGLYHEYTLRMVQNYGTLCWHQGRLTEAESLYQRVLLGYTRKPPENPKRQLLMFYDIGRLYQTMQNFEKAKKFFGKAYEGRLKLLGSQHNGTIKALIQVNIETELKDDSAAFVSGGVIPISVPEQTTEAELWAKIENIVAEKIRGSSAENTSRASQNDTENGEESEQESKSCITAIVAYMLMTYSYRVTGCGNQCGNQSGERGEGWDKAGHFSSATVIVTDSLGIHNVRS